MLLSFSDLLDSERHGLEVSYNAAGILSHMTSDGEEQWTLSAVSREECMCMMV